MKQKIELFNKRLRITRKIFYIVLVLMILTAIVLFIINLKYDAALQVITYDAT